MRLKKDNLGFGLIGCGLISNWHAQAAWRLFYFITLSYWFSLYVYSPFLSPYLESLGASYGMIGFIMASYGLAAVFFRIPTGIVSDRLSIGLA